MELDIELLKCFEAVVDQNGFTQAGKHLGLSQSAVSQRIQRLEDRISKKLFSKAVRGIELSADGEVLLSYARRILSLHDEAVQWIQQPSMKGNLRIGFVDYFGPDLLPEIVSKFSKAYPNIHLELHAGLGMNLDSIYQEGNLDILLAGAGINGNGERIMTDPVVWAYKDGHGLETFFSADCIEQMPLVTLPQPCVFRAMAINMLDAYSKSWDVVFTGTGVASVLAAARAGLGITALPRSAVTKDLSILSSDHPLASLPEFSTYLYHNQNISTELVKGITDYLKIQLKKRQ